MMPDLYWDGLFEVIERTLNPRRKRTLAPPFKRITKRKPKAKAKAKAAAEKRPTSRVAPKNRKAAEAKKPRAKTAAQRSPTSCG
jgi:hypothetical protein